MSVTFLGSVNRPSAPVPFYSFRIPAGFPSPAQDHLEQRISLDELLGLRAPHISLARSEDDGMRAAGVFGGDLLVIDRAREARAGEIVIARLDNEVMVRRLMHLDRGLVLIRDNDTGAGPSVCAQEGLLILGVVRYSLRCHCPQRRATAAAEAEPVGSLDELLKLRLPHVYLARSEGQSMVQAGIFSGDLLIIDRSLDATLGEIVIAAVNNEPLVKRYSRLNGRVVLLSESPGFAPRYILEGDELRIWGVVRYSVRCHDLDA